MVAPESNGMRNPNGSPGGTYNFSCVDSRIAFDDDTVFGIASEVDQPARRVLWRGEPPRSRGFDDGCQFLIVELDTLRFLISLLLDMSRDLARSRVPSSADAIRYSLRPIRKKVDSADLQRATPLARRRLSGKNAQIIPKLQDGHGLPYHTHW